MSMLPQELVNVIVDFLKGDEKYLRSCLSSAHCFAERARMHLFRHVIVSSPLHLKELLSLFGISPSLLSMIHTIKFCGRTSLVPADWIFNENTTHLVFKALGNVENSSLKTLRFLN